MQVGGTVDQVPSWGMPVSLRCPQNGHVTRSVINFWFALAQTISKLLEQLSQVSDFSIVNEPLISFHVSGSRVRWGNEVQPMSKWRGLLASLRWSWSLSVVRILSTEVGNLPRRMREILRNRSNLPAVSIPPCPAQLREWDRPVYLAGSYQHACTQDMKLLAQANSWMGELELVLASEGWRLGATWAADKLRSKNYTTVPASSSTPCGSGNSMPPQPVQQHSKRDP